MRYLEWPRKESRASRSRGNDTVAYARQNRRTISRGLAVAAEGQRQNNGKTEMEWSHGVSMIHGQGCVVQP